MGSSLEPFRLQPVRIAALLLGRWRLVVGAPVLAAILAAAVSLLIPSQYESRVLLLPEVGSSGQLPSGVATVASQLGISIPTEPGRSADFYGDLVRSRIVLEEVLRARYQVPRSHPSTDPDSATLLDILRVRGATQLRRMENGREWLLLATRIDVAKTGIIFVRVRALHPELAAAVADQYVTAVNRFNTERRQSQARQRRVFLEGRVAAVDGELRDAEDVLRGFYERNRRWQSSPKLLFEEGRLRRQIDARRELLLGLRRELETARVAEVNDVPVVTLIESAVPASAHVSPNRTFIVVGSAGFALLMVVFGLLLHEHHAQLAAMDDSLELRENWRRFLNESRLGRMLPARRR